jgi:hypothetical protein
MEETTYNLFMTKIGNESNIADVTNNEQESQKD